MTSTGQIILFMATVIGSGVSVIAFIYMFIRNFKADFNARMDRQDNRIDLLEERMFYLATGKTLTQAIIDEKLKQGAK